MYRNANDSDDLFRAGFDYEDSDDYAGDAESEKLSILAWLEDEDFGDAEVFTADPEEE